jgi:hypothetical protein
MEKKPWVEKRTALDPAAYVQKFNEFQRGYFEAEVVSIDGVTPSGRKKYTIRITPCKTSSGSR